MVKRTFQGNAHCSYLTKRIYLSLTLLLIACSVPQPVDAQALTLHFIDVGQGDSVLIQSPSGQNVLYDGGRKDDDALAYLQSVGVTKLDLVIASHADADHIGGLEAVVDYYRPKLFLDNGLPHPTQTYEGLIRAVRDAGSQLVPPTARRIGLGDASLQVIPPPDDSSLSSNDHSVGVIVSYGAFDAAMTGDAEQPELAWWLTNVPELLKPVEVYKAAHHGSANGDSPDSVETFKPDAVVISVGLDNAYGHPTAEALALYDSIGAQVYRTDLQGTIIVTANSDGTYQVNADPSESTVATPVPAVTAEPENAPGSRLTYDPYGPDRDCGDFSSQAEAQAFFEAAGGPASDPHRLDSDSDGEVCESLP